MEKVPMTAPGYKALEEELKTLKEVERPRIIEAIATAREHGDLSENAEYHAAREQQSFNEGRIQELESVISRADVIDPTQFSGQKVIRFGASVDLADEETDEEVTYSIVGHYEADSEKKRLSVQAPIARALIGKEVGDSVKVQSPGGVRSYEVLDVRYSE